MSIIITGPKPLILPMARVHQAVHIRYKTSVINPDGTVAKTRPWKNNLILDQGLNNMASNFVGNLWSAAAVGTGTGPTKRDSGVVAMSRSGNVVTADGAFFGSGDVGRLLKFDSGEEVYINAYTDSTHVETTTSGTIASSPGTIWYVNQTGLVTEAKRSNTYRLESGDNFSTWNGTDGYTMQRTFQFSAEVGSVTYTEVGWAHTISAGGNLFGRDVIPGGGDSLIAGQQYQIVVQLTNRISPSVPTAVANAGTGIDTAGEFMPLVNTVVTSITTTGGQTGTGYLEAGGLANQLMALIGSGTFTLPTAINGASTIPAAASAYRFTNAGYTAGNFYLDGSAVVGVSFGNMTIHGFGWGGDINGFGLYAGHSLVHKLTTPHVKANTHSLSVTLRRSWSRVLVN